MGNMTQPSCALPPAANDGSELGKVIGEVEKQFGVMVINARKNIRERSAAIHPELQPLGFKVLTILSQSGPLQQVHLAEEVHSDKAMMSRTIKQLESLGLVTRTVDPTDGRAMLVDMTAEARSRHNASLAKARQLLSERFSTWEIDEVRRLADLLARLNETRT